MNRINWDQVTLCQQTAEEKRALVQQKQYQERYGDELTKAIKVAQHNQRKEK